MTSRSSSRAMPESFATLDGLRGLGALLVVVGHFSLFGNWLKLPSGPVVVDMFFMLSGFVLAFAYEPRFAKGMGPGKFMLQRVVRLYPLYLVGILIGALVFITAAMDEPDAPISGRLVQLAAQLLVLPAPIMTGDRRLYPFDGPAWTMFFEFAVNLAYIFAWPLLKNTRVLIAVVVASVLGLAIAAWSYGALDVGWGWQNFWGGFARVSFSFFGGVLIFRLAGSPTKPVEKRSWWALAPIIALPFIIQIPATPELRPLVDVLIVVFLGPAMIGAAQAIEPPRMLVRLFTYAGAISYAIYIVHWPLLKLGEHIAWRLPAELTDALPMNLIFAVVAIAVSMVIERFYDVPVRAWLGRKLKGRKSATPVKDAAKAG